MRVMIPRQSFGRTGHESTRIIFGAAALSTVTQDEADQTMELIRSFGVNHLDVAASYGDAELRLGPHLERHRDDYFLATKTGERSRDAAYAEIQRSLELLRTDRLDLLQLHNLVDEPDWQTAFAPGGALEAAVRARDEGIVRFIGVTGHGLPVARQHLRSLDEFDFDSVLLPYNFPMARNEQYLAEFEALAEICRTRGVAMQTIKAITRAPWGDRVQTTNTWYEPLQDQQAIDAAVSWVLGRTDVFLNTVGDIHILPKVLDAADRFTERPDDAAMAELERSWHLEPLFA